MKWTLLLLFFCSCATQRTAEKYFDENTDKLADYVDKNKPYTQEYGGAYAAKHFPPRFYPPAVYSQKFMLPLKLQLKPHDEKEFIYLNRFGAKTTSSDKTTILTKTVYIQDTTLLEAQGMDLKLERRVNKALRKQLKLTEAERDYWREKNRKKFWALIAMAVFGALYIIFKELANKVSDA